MNTANKEQAASGGEVSAQQIRDLARKHFGEAIASFSDYWQDVTDREVQAFARELLAAASPSPTASAAQQEYPTLREPPMPTFDDWRGVVMGALDDSEKALRVLSTMLRKEKLMKGFAVADEILGSIGQAKTLVQNYREAQQQGERVAELDLYEANQRHVRPSAEPSPFGPDGLRWGMMKHAYEVEIGNLKEQIDTLTRERDEARRELAEVRGKADICGSCGKTALLPCPRPADHPCLREHNGGTRSALATSSKGGGA